MISSYTNSPISYHFPSGYSKEIVLEGNMKYFDLTSATKSELTSISILSGNVLSITDAQFQNSNLRYVNIPNVTNIGTGAFYECTNLTSINCSNVSSIGTNAFASCTNLSAINIPKITEIGNGVFLQCSRLTSINIPNVTQIGPCAFEYCLSLTSINIPNVTVIVEGAFDSCPNLTSITIANSNNNFRLLTKDNQLSNSGIVLIDENNHNVIWGSIPECENVILPNDVSSIGEVTFSRCSSLSSINCPNVTNIKYGAFDSCPNLTSINCPNVSSIGETVFYGCSSLTSINIPNVTQIGPYAFEYCTNLKHLCLSSVTEVTTIGENVFDGVSQCSVHVPNSLLEDFKIATNWSTYLENRNIDFVGL